MQDEATANLVIKGFISLVCVITIYKTLSGSAALIGFVLLFSDQQFCEAAELLDH